MSNDPLLHLCAFADSQRSQELGTGRREQAVQDLNWFLENKPAGIDLEQIREMQNAFRKKAG